MKKSNHNEAKKNHIYVRLVGNRHGNGKQQFMIIAWMAMRDMIRNRLIFENIRIFHAVNKKLQSNSKEEEEKKTNRK